MFFDTFNWVVCCIFAFMYFLALSAKRHFHLRWKRSYRSWNCTSESALRCPEKSKTRIQASWWAFIKSQDSDWRKIDKGLVYPNAYCSITATTIKSNLSNTAWYMKKHQLRPDLWILTGQFRKHLTETYNEPRAKKGCHGRWLKLVEVGFQSFVSPFSLWFFFITPPENKMRQLSASVVVTALDRIITNART
jgi:hypothetical protein